MLAKRSSHSAIAALISSISLLFFSISKREILLIGIFKRRSTSSKSISLTSSALNGAKPVITAFTTVS